MSASFALSYHRLPASAPHEVPGMKVSVDEVRCTGHGRCYALCPQVFQEDEAGRCVIEQETVPRQLQDKVRMAADNCPELAIRVAD